MTLIRKRISARIQRPRAGIERIFACASRPVTAGNASQFPKPLSASCGKRRFQKRQIDADTRTPVWRQDPEGRSGALMSKRTQSRQSGSAACATKPVDWHALAAGDPRWSLRRPASGAAGRRTTRPPSSGATGMRRVWWSQSSSPVWCDHAGGRGFRHQTLGACCDHRARTPAFGPHEFSLQSHRRQGRGQAIAPWRFAGLTQDGLPRSCAAVGVCSI